MIHSSLLDPSRFCSLLEHNVVRLIIFLMSNFQKDHRDMLTLKSMCLTLKKSKSLQSLRDVIGLVMLSYGKTKFAAIDIGYNSFLEYMKDPRWNTRNAQGL